METSGKYHVVAQGECLSSITKLYDYSDHQIIYNHPNNVELKRQRPNPNVLYPGDKLFIPNKECKKVPAATGKRHKYVRHRPKVMLRLVVKDENWEPFLGRHYQLKFNTLAKPYSGTTSASDGKIEHPQAGEPEIGSDVEEGELTVWLSDDSSQPPAVWKLKLGHLDPVEELTGVQKRLANLGFPTGEPDGELNEPTKGALAAFPTLAGQEASADNDQKTRDALVQNHDKLSSQTDSGKAVPFVKMATAYASRLHKGSPKDELSATLSVHRVFRFSI